MKNTSPRWTPRIRKALLSEVAPIHRLVNEFAGGDLMLPLSVGDVTDRLRDFWVALDGGEVIGSVAVHVTWGKLVEIRSLAVRKDLQKRGLGRRLVKAALKEAWAMGADEVFTLTYIPGYFKHFGFKVCDRGELPHKVWVDCVKCPKFPDCGETAMRLNLVSPRKRWRVFPPARR